MKKQAAIFLKGLLLSILCAIYPVLFLYSNNVSILPLSAVLPALLIMVAIAGLVFGSFSLVKKSALRGSISSFAFMVFFHTYGSLYARLEKLETIQIEHYTVFPVVIVCTIYAAFFLSKLRPRVTRQLQNVLLLVVITLICFNLVRSLPIELKRAYTRQSKEQATQAQTGEPSSYPDIYFIILDEYSGFDALEGYWHTEGYKGFQAFLEENGFFIARHSHSATIDTIVEMASRLNMQQYPIPNNVVELFEPIANNQVMRILKNYGYTTVVIDGSMLAYPTKPEIYADHNFSVDSNRSRGFLATDEFSILFYNQSMLRIFSNDYMSNPFSQETFRNMLAFSLQKAADLHEIPTPKFVYLHLMLPHWPFMFDENGDPVDATHQFDWQYYLGQHMYASQKAQELVTQILVHASPDRPPVIILQSDHGARNILDKGGQGEILENYPEDYKTNILNALYLPGFDTSQLPDNFAPVETFAILLNHYFHAGISVEK